MGNIVGTNYSNISEPEGEGEPSQHPYFAIRGVDIFDDENGLDKKSDGKDPVDNGVKRFLVNVSPHSNCLSSNTILNIDSNQLYAPSNGTKNSYTYGASCEGYYGGTEYCPSAEKAGGVYSNPAPIVGAPVQFRRVFFRGRNADPIKGNISGSERAYSAVFACSNPVDVTTISNGDCYGDPSGTIYNPRDENVQYASFAYEKEWDEIEIFGGGCKNAFSIISGQTYDSYEGLGLTGYQSSGCDSFIFSGCSGILTQISGNQITVCYTGSGAGCESFTGFYANSGKYKASGCDSFQFTGKSGIHTFITGNVLTIADTGCRETFTGFYANFGKYKASGCDSFRFRGVSGIHTSITGNILTIADTGCRETFTGFSGDSGAYQANGCDLFNINGGTNIKTRIQSDSLTISAPNFASSGCINVSKNTETNTITYGISKNEMLTCLGYIETGFRVLMPTGDEMPTGFSDLTMCYFEMLYKCPEDDTTYISGCCVDPEGACCENGSCSVKSEGDCGGYFWGVGTNCTDQPGGGSAPYYNYTIAQLCQEGVGCVWNSEPAGGGSDPVGYECYDGGFGTVTRKEYLDHIASDSKYHSESQSPASSFHVGDQ